MITRDKALEVAIVALDNLRHKYASDKIMFELYGDEKLRGRYELWHEYNEAIQILGALRNPTHGLPLWGGNDNAT